MFQLDFNSYHSFLQLSGKYQNLITDIEKVKKFFYKLKYLKVFNKQKSSCKLINILSFIRRVNKVNNITTNEIIVGFEGQNRFYSKGLLWARPFFIVNGFMRLFYVKFFYC